MILLGLGTNLGDRERNLSTALALLEQEQGVRIEKASRIYETAPFGVTDQPDFLNMVVRVRTSLSTDALLHACLSVEARMGRVRTRRWGPRIIDIDLLVYDRHHILSRELVLPHPGILHRAFVLIPLRDVAPRVRLSNGKTAAAAAKDLSAQERDSVKLWKTVSWDSRSECFV